VDEYQLPTVVARTYYVKEEALKKSIQRSRNRQRNSQGVFNKHGGNNKILDVAQERAIFQYYFNQWEMGIGATHAMVYASICHLKGVGNLIPSL
jgi:creatinine amidohydrolase/Fe(II)-dependent formamide hydrolase-like protein